MYSTESPLRNKDLLPKVWLSASASQLHSGTNHCTSPAPDVCLEGTSDQAAGVTAGQASEGRAKLDAGRAVKGG